MNILDFIPVGKENAKSKQKLMQETGIRDERLLRDTIKRLVKSGVPILSSSGHKGYWYSEDENEIAEFIRENDHRSREIMSTTAKLKKHLYEIQNIKVTPVRQHYRRLDSGNVMGQIRMEVN